MYMAYNTCIHMFSGIVCITGLLHGHVCMYTCMYVCKCVYVHVHVHTHVNVYTFDYIDIYVHMVAIHHSCLHVHTLYT